MYLILFPVLLQILSLVLVTRSQSWKIDVSASETLLNRVRLWWFGLFF